MENDPEALVPQPDNPSGVVKQPPGIHPLETAVDNFWSSIRGNLMRNADLYRQVAREVEALKAAIRNHLDGHSP